MRESDPGQRGVLREVRRGGGRSAAGSGGVRAGRGEEIAEHLPLVRGALVGFPGIHDVYAGQTGKGLTQLLLSVLTCWILWLWMFIRAIVEVCAVTEDAAGVPML
jgi:hypothetical protein